MRSGRPPARRFPRTLQHSVTNTGADDLIFLVIYDPPTSRTSRSGGYSVLRLSIHAGIQWVTDFRRVP